MNKKMRYALIGSILFHGILLIFMIAGPLFHKKKDILTSAHMIVDFEHVSDKSKAPHLGPGSSIQKQKKTNKPPKQEKDNRAPIKQERVLPPEAPQEEPKSTTLNKETERAIKDTKKTKEEKKEVLKNPKKEPDLSRKVDVSKKHPKKIPPKMTKPDTKKTLDKKIVPVKKTHIKLDSQKTQPHAAIKKNSKSKSTTNTPLNKAQVNLNDRTTDQKGVKKGGKKIDLDDALESIDGTGINAQEIGALSGSEIDLIRKKIYECWNVPAGAKDAKNLIVDIEIKLTPDGMVKEAKISDECKARMRHDGFFKIAAESALRAVLDPRCQPFPLPKEKYQLWKEIMLTFNPADMF